MTQRHLLDVPQGIAKGEVSFVIESPPERGEKQPRRTRVQLPITLEIISTPPRHTSHISVDHNASKRFVCPDRMCGVVQVIVS